MRDRESIFLTSLAASPVAVLRGDRGRTRSLVGPDRGPAHNVDLHVNELDPRSGPGPKHYHQHAENLYWVLQGRILVEFEGSQVEVGRDDVLLIPPGLVHATSNPFDELARFVEIYAPSGPDFHVVDGAGP